MVMGTLENLNKYNIYLCSASPRRKELLGKLDIEFAPLKATEEVDEVYPEDLPTSQIPEFLSKLKVQGYKSHINKSTLLITADTIVACADKVLGKPKDKSQAIEMLQNLSGAVHKVITGVTITTEGKSKTFSVTTEVEMAKISDEEINYYVEKYRPYDKAGAYGIQEWIGCIGIKGLKGSFYNVMGLPVQRLYEELKNF